MMRGTKTVDVGVERPSSLGIGRGVSTLAVRPTAAAPLSRSLSALLAQAGAVDANLARQRKHGRSRVEWEKLQAAVQSSTRQTFDVAHVQQLIALVPGLLDMQYDAAGKVVVTLPPQSASSQSAAVGSPAWLVARRAALTEALRAHAQRSPGAPLPTPPPLAPPPPSSAKRKRMEAAAAAAAAPPAPLRAASRRCPPGATKSERRHFHAFVPWLTEAEGLALDVARRVEHALWARGCTSIGELASCDDATIEGAASAASAASKRRASAIAATLRARRAGERDGDVFARLRRREASTSHSRRTPGEMAEARLRTSLPLLCDAVHSFFTTSGARSSSDSSSLGGRSSGGGRSGDGQMRYGRTAVTVGQLAAEVVDKSFSRGFDVEEARAMLAMLCARVPEWCYIEAPIDAAEPLAEKAADDARVFRIDAAVNFARVRAKLSGQ